MTPNGMVRSYRVEYTTASATTSVNTSSTSVVLTGLEIFTNYQVQVFATTVAEGVGSEIVMVTTDEDSKFRLSMYYISLLYFNHVVLILTVHLSIYST